MSYGGAVLSDLAADPHGKHPEYAGHDPEKQIIDEPAVGNHAIGAHGRRGVMAPAWKVMDRLERHLGVEARGIERVPATERHHVRTVDNLWLWLGANCTIVTFALGTLGSSIWAMGFRDAALTIIFFNLASSLVPAYFSTFGKATGVRALAFGRFTFGFFGVYLPTIFNLIGCLGWCVSNSIAGGLVLRAATTSNRLPLTAAIIILTIGTFIISFFGYRIVHLYERYSWIPVAIIFLIVLGQSARFMEAQPWGASGEAGASSVLSFGAAIVGFSFGWLSMAGDYTVNMPQEASSFKLFLFTYIGLNIPMILLELLGAAVVTTFNSKPSWGAAYESENIGGILGSTLVGPMGGIGSFFMIVLGLSVIQNNIPNIYSFAMTFQVLPGMQAIPRPLIILAGSILYCALACAGQSSFVEVYGNLLLFLSYWLAMFATLILLEHLVFRKGKWINYDVERYDVPSTLPVGLAAFAGICAGWVGAVLGMSTTFFIGPIGKLVGDPAYGTDLGFLLAIGFSAVVFLPLRFLEEKKFGR